jgi:serine/threonine-protein kinase
VDGKSFGRYRLIELLGRGGMGEVWCAHDTATNRTVAIKLLPPYLAQDTTFVQRFRREAQAAAQLNNPHIIPIHNYGEIDGRLYVDMRLIEGRNLQEVLAEGPMEPARAVRIIEHVAKALQAAHKIGLMHRDVKPSNILLDEDDFAYLIDFGIARGADQTRMTGTHTIIGSWHYMPPERLRAGQVDARSDIYALACVLYECLTCSTPYPGDNFEQQMTAHLMEPPPRPSTTQPDVPAQFDAVIAKGMAKDPDNRYATTVELADAARDAIAVPVQRATPRHAGPPHDVGKLADAIDQHPTQLASSSPTPVQPLAQQPPRPPRNRRTPWIIAAVAVVVALLAATVSGFGSIKNHQVTGQLTELRREQADRDTVAQLAKDYALKSLTYSYEDPNAYFRSVEDGVSQQLKDKYVNATDTLKNVMVQARVTSTGEVLAADPVAQPGGIYQVVVSAHQTTRNLENPTPKTSIILLQVTVSEVGNAWLVSDVGPKTGAHDQPS